MTVPIFSHSQTFAGGRRLFVFTDIIELGSIGRTVKAGELRYYLLNLTVFLTIPQNSADKVIKIHKDKIEFERDVKRWTQRLNEPPGRELQ